MSRWFRSYADTHRNPKVARLSDADFRLWHELLCIASENDGRIPSALDLKIILKRRLDHLSEALKRLVNGGLIEALAGGYAPRNWDERQYKSDTSTSRVQKHRARGNVSGNVPVTPPETEAEISVSNDTGAAAPSDPLKELFDVGVSILIESGQTEKQARSLIGKWRKENPPAKVLAALLECRAGAITNPVEWLTKRLASAKWISKSGYEYRGDDDSVMRQAEKRADWRTYWAIKGRAA